MTEDERDYWLSQLSLFTGGYEQIMVEFTVHFDVAEDVIQFGTVMTDSHTREIVGMEVHQETIRLSDELTLAREIVRRVRLVRNFLEPFPGS
jgi:hypothetical protein